MTAEQTTTGPQTAARPGLTAYVKERAPRLPRDNCNAMLTLLAEAMAYRYPETKVGDVAKNLNRMASWVEQHGTPDAAKLIRWAERIERADEARAAAPAAAPSLPEQFEACLDDEAELALLDEQLSPAEEALLALCGSQPIEPFGLVGVLVAEGTDTGRAIVHVYTQETKAPLQELVKRLFASIGGADRVRFSTYEFRHAPANAKPDGGAAYPHMKV